MIYVDVHLINQHISKDWFLSAPLLYRQLIQSLPFACKASIPNQCAKTVSSTRGSHLCSAAGVAIYPLGFNVTVADRIAATNLEVFRPTLVWFFIKKLPPVLFSFSLPRSILIVLGVGCFVFLSELI